MLAGLAYDIHHAYSTRTAAATRFIITTIFRCSSALVPGEAAAVSLEITTVTD